MVGFWFHRNRSEEERKEVQIKMLTGYTQVNLMDWTASFNNEVRKAWKEDVKNKEAIQQDGGNRMKKQNQQIHI